MLAIYNSLIYLLTCAAQVSLAIFITYIYTNADHYLRPDTAFVTLTFLGVIRVAVNTAPPMLSDMIKAAVSIGRLSRYLNQSELDTNNVCRDYFGSGKRKLLFKKSALCIIFKKIKFIHNYFKAFCKYTFS